VDGHSALCTENIRRWLRSGKKAAASKSHMGGGRARICARNIRLCKKLARRGRATSIPWTTIQSSFPVRLRTTSSERIVGIPHIDGTQLDAKRWCHRLDGAELNGTGCNRGISKDRCPRYPRCDLLRSPSHLPAMEYSKGVKPVV